MKNKKHRKIIIIISLIVLVCLLFTDSVYRSIYCLSISEYSVKSEKIEKAIKIIHLSDLHNAEFGENNELLLKEIRKQEPDAIFCTGDMITGTESGTDTAAALIEDLVKIAPTYVSLGNHEIMYEKNYGENIEALYEKAGAVVLESEYIDTEIGGQSLRLGGIYGYCLPEEYIEGNAERQKEADFVKDFQDTESFTMLLCHMPVCFIENGGLNKWDVDLVFSGHAHGGQIRLPFIGGLYAPDQGFFPGEVSGVYYSENSEKALVLSRGLGSSGPLPRINNVPEITVVDIVPQNTED